LVIVYAKNEMDDIPQRAKSALNEAIAKIEMGLGRLFSEGKTRDQGKE
jgi:hypothetical protein